MTAALLALAGCEVAPERPAIRPTGDPVVDGNAERNAAPAKDRVLWDYRIAASALRAGNDTEAKAKLDDALAFIGGLITNDAAARKARSLFAAEDTKIFIGEPYERVMAYYYRGLLYWRDGQPDNARACFRSAQLADSDAEAAADRSDYVLLDYLDGLASAKLSADGGDAYARATKLAKHELPPYDPAANVLVFAEFGHGPRKYAGGQYGEQLRFRTQDSKIRSAILKVAGQTVYLTPWDDLNFQATTRGGRVMDYILGRKAVFKQSANAVGDVALVGANIAADNAYKKKTRPDGTTEITRDNDAENTALALGAIGVLSKIASAATTPQADTRTWDNLPQYLSFSALHLPAGTHPARLEFFDAAGHRMEALTRTLALTVEDPARDTVVFLSELKR